MTIKMIQDRLDSYNCQSIQEEEFALKEITQELVLHSLSNASFFKKAAFQGGTCLRILHGLNRFSEDLDFALLEPDPAFELKPYLSAVNEELSAFGYNMDVQTRDSNNSVIRNAFLKDDSIGRIINVQYRRADGPSKSLKIKLEIDINPPIGGKSQVIFHDFPVFFSVTTHDLPSLFAGKSHALLARPYVKGRDWFDFLWYVTRKITPNFGFLSNSLNQLGPWQGKHISTDMEWYQREMALRIKGINWKVAKTDVQRFLRPIDAKMTDIWSSDFFLDVLKKLVPNS